MRKRDDIYEDMLKNHYLEQVLDTEKFKAFYLRQPGMGRMQSCLFMFTPEGVNICGDLCPGNDSRNSGVHAYGYGLSWFSQNLSGSYLCEKFLTKEWHPELAVDDCLDIAERIMLGDTHQFDRDQALEELLDERHTIAEQLGDYRHDLKHLEPEGPPAEEILNDIKDLRVEAAGLRKKLIEKRTEYAEKYRELAARGGWRRDGRRTVRGGAARDRQRFLGGLSRLRLPAAGQGAPHRPQPQVRRTVSRS